MYKNSLNTPRITRKIYSGEWFYYSDNGKLMTYELWENGKIINKKDFE